MGSGVDCLGERGVIGVLCKHFSLMPNLPVSFGDDVSAVSLGGGVVVVLKTDMLVAKTDVPVSMSLFDAAQKAIVMCVSDFASKGVQPTAVLVGLGLPKNLTSQAAVTELACGLDAAAQKYGAYIIGGDIAETGDLTISVSLYGTAKQEDLMLRSGARSGDILAVTGTFGKPPAGLQMLLNKNCTASVELRSVLEDAVFHPTAHLTEGLALVKSGAVSASLDSSDGLAWSLHELMNMSGVGFIVDHVPIAPEAVTFAKQNGLNAEHLALYGGEEYELVLTINPNKWNTAKAAVEAVGGSLIAIGKATKEKQVNLISNGTKQVIEPLGYEHFKAQV